MPEIKYEQPGIETSPEKQAAVNKPEQIREQASASQSQEAQPNLQYLPSSNAADQTPRLNLRRRVEDTLSQGLENIYLDMDANTQIKFRQKGEETSQKIAGLLQKGKATLKKVLSLIVDWLKIIPGINRHFLEQEAKIKADQIMKIQNK